MKYIKALLPFALIIMLSGFTVLPFFHPGFFPSHDDTQIGRIQQMHLALSDGLFPVRWVKDLGYGYGYPIFNYYSPLSYYIGAFFAAVGFHVLTATKVTFVLAIISAGMSMYILLQRYFGHIAAVTGAVLYVYFPYHALDVYVRGNLAETFAYAVLPLVFFGLFRIYESSRTPIKKLPWTAISITGISTAALILSHNLTALMTSIIGILAAVFLLVFSKRRKDFFLWLALSGLMAIGLSAFFWLPAVAEMGYSNVRSQIGGGADYPDHFVCLSQLWNSSWGYAGSAPGCLDGMSFRLGKSNIIITIASLIVIFAGIYKKRKLKNLPIIVLNVLLLFISLFLSLPYSQILWDLLPLAAFIQFPWRFLLFTALFSSFIIASAMYVLLKVFELNKIILAGISVSIILVTLIINTKLFQPQQYIVHPPEYYHSQSYLEWYVSRQSDEYLPKDFQEIDSEDETTTKILEIIKGSGEILAVSEKTGMISAQVNVSEPSVVLVRLGYYPNWNILTDGESADFRVTPQGVEIFLEPGSHDILAQYRQTTVEITANSISLLTLIGFVAGYWYIKRKDE